MLFSAIQLWRLLRLMSQIVNCTWVFCYCEKNEKEIFGLKIIGSVHHLCVNSYSERSHNKSTWTVRWQHEKSFELSYYDEITMFSLTVLFTRGLCQAEKQCKPMYRISSKFLVFFFEQINFGFFRHFQYCDFFGYKWFVCNDSCHVVTRRG